MARQRTTSDVFNAVAESRRRQILDLLARGEQSVAGVAVALGVTQPQASKHLCVLKLVGLVAVRGAGPQRFYRLDATGLRPVHDWVETFERFWAVGLDSAADSLDDQKDWRKAHDPRR